MIPSFRSLREFLSWCQEHNQLAVIDRRVSSHLELSEIADRVMHQSGGGKALLFTNVEGSRYPVAINILGSEQRMAWALGENSLDRVEQRIAKLAEIEPPRSLGEGWDLLGRLAELRHAPPRRVRSGPCFEVTDPHVDLSSLPVLTTWPEDAGPFITWPAVYSKSPNGRANCGMYRMQVLDKTSTGMHWQRQKDGRRHLDEAGRRIPVAVSLGGPPVCTWAATAPLPPDIFEMLLAGFLQRRRVPMVRLANGIEVPAESDFVLEGYVDPEDLRWEGPFGDHTGYYSQADWYPAFHVEKIHHRRDAIFPATLVGLPPKEDNYMGLATERLFLPLLRRIHGEIRHMHLPPEGVFHNLVLAGVRKRYPGHAYKAFHAVWGTGQMMFTKCVVATDENVDLRDGRAVLAALDQNWDAERDTLITSGPMDTLDHACPQSDFGGKIGLDATTKTREDQAGKPLSPSAHGHGASGWEFAREDFPEIVKLSIPQESEGRVLLLLIEKDRPDQGLDLLKRLRSEHLSPRILFVAIFDEPEALLSASRALTIGGNNLDPRRDVVRLRSPRPGGALGLDCTRKRSDEGYGRGEWPRLIHQAPEIVAKVDGYWKELGL